MRKIVANLIQLLNLKSAERLGTDAKGNIIAKDPVDVSGFAATDDPRFLSPEKKTTVDKITETKLSHWDSSFSKKVVSASITGDENKTLTITMQDGSAVTASFTDIDTGVGTDIKLNTLNWDSETGVLTAVTSDGNTITASLDGRYAPVANLTALRNTVDNLHLLFTELGVVSVSTTTASITVASTASLFAVRIKEGSNISLKFGTTSGGEELGNYTGSAGDVVTLSFINARTIYVTADATGKVVPIVYNFKN